MPHAIIRGANGRRHEVDFGDAPVRVEIHSSEDTVEIYVEADFERLPEGRRRFALVSIPRDLFSEATAAAARLNREPRPCILRLIADFGRSAEFGAAWFPVRVMPFGGSLIRGPTRSRQDRRRRSANRLAWFAAGKLAAPNSSTRLSYPARSRAWRAAPRSRPGQRSPGPCALGGTTG
jgi:hypothetical protein